MNLTRVKILAFLEKYGPARGTQIARELGLPISTVYNALKEMRLEGLVEYDENSKNYRITEQGMATLERIRRELAVGVVA